MSQQLVAPHMAPVMPHAWRFLVIALGTLILCSCRGIQEGNNCPPGTAGRTPPTLPQEAYTGGAPPVINAAAPKGPPGMELGVPLPYTPVGPWAPPGIAQPWPHDEYLCDGGVHEPGVAVTPDGQVQGLDMEDTIAVYDTADGRKLVEPSNRVCVYSPRFRSVRQVTGVELSQQSARSAGVYTPEQVNAQAGATLVAAHKQNVQTAGQIGEKGLTILRSRQWDGTMSTLVGPRAFHDAFLPYENLAAIRTGKYANTEMVRLAQGRAAAVTWAGVEGVQVILDQQAAAAVVKNQNVEEIFSVEEKKTSPKLRIIKVASTQFAEPGDTIDFTLRFDNVGTQTIGNVTILDSLTTRLEYVPDTAQASKPANFSFQPNEGGSLVLRWEITEPVKPGDGGILRFRCRVR